MDAADISMHISCNGHWQERKGRRRIVKRTPLVLTKLDHILMQVSTGKKSNVSAANILMMMVMKKYIQGKKCCEGYGSYESLDIWEKRLCRYASTICYWTTVRDYLLINYRFIRVKRLGDWPLTMSACNDICPWFFAFEHTNYARWMPVFICDMARLPDTYPSVHKAFMEGKFVVQLSDKKASLAKSIAKSFLSRIVEQMASMDSQRKRLWS